MKKNMVSETNKKGDLILRFGTRVTSVLKERVGNNVVSVCLFGSAARETLRKGSDIDIQLYSSTKSDVLRKLIGKYRVKKEEWVSKTSNGETNRFYHMLVPLEDGAEAEISVTDPERIGERRKDAVYEDDITGLSVLELRSVLRDDPLRRFVPEKKKG